jgi:hypothetical protein
MSTSDYTEVAIANWMLRSVSLTAPSEIHVALFLVMPNEFGSGGSEPSATTYARTQYGPGGTFWSAIQSGTGTSENINEVIFNRPNGELWGDIVGFGLYDELGNLLCSKAFAEVFPVASDDPAPKFSAGTLVIDFSWGRTHG